MGYLGKAMEWNHPNYTTFVHIKDTPLNNNLRLISKRDPFYPPEYNVVMLGTGGVGKTVLTSKFWSGDISNGCYALDSYCRQFALNVPQNEYDDRDANGSQMVLLNVFDTVGDWDVFSEYEHGWIREGQIFMLVFSVVRKSSFEEIVLLRERVLRAKDDDNCPIIAVGSKCDLRMDDCCYNDAVDMDQLHELVDEWCDGDVAMNNSFAHLSKLHLDHEEYGEIGYIRKRMTEWELISCLHITKLKLDSFGGDDEPVNFDSFCEFLNSFQNVSDLTLTDVHLSSFDEKNDHFGTILPKLTTLRCGGLGSNESANIFRNALIKRYSKQLGAIDYDEEHKQIDVHSFVNLKQISVRSARDHSLINIVNSAQSLKHLELYEIVKSPAVRKAIIKSLPNLEFLSLSALEDQMESTLKYLEIGLIESQILNEKLRIEVNFVGSGRRITADDIVLFANRLVNALDVSNTEDFIVMFRFPKLYNSMDKIMFNNLKKSHSLFFAEDEDSNNIKTYISNKGCKMSGHHQRMSNEW